MAQLGPDTPTPGHGSDLRTRLRGKGWALGLTGFSVVVILLLFGALSSTAGLQTATEAQPRALKSPVLTSTPVSTIVPTMTPGPGTPTAISKVACPPAGCPFT